MPRILVIEDSDTKYRAVSAVVDRSFDGLCTHVRAANINQAEDYIAKEGWDLILLDISMDIAASAVGPAGRGHANLGGLNIARKMFLKGREAPTIVVTAHDAFESDARRAQHIEIVDLKSIHLRAKDYLGEAYVGHVRYAETGWEAELDLLIRTVVPR